MRDEVEKIVSNELERLEAKSETNSLTCEDVKKLDLLVKAAKSVGAFEKDPTDTEEEDPEDYEVWIQSMRDSNKVQ